MPYVITIYLRSLGFAELLESQYDGSSHLNDNSAAIQRHTKVVHYCQERNDSGMCCCVKNAGFHVGFGL